MQDGSFQSIDGEKRRAHLVGVTGSGMRALASVLAGWGWQLTGSDLRTEPEGIPGVKLFAGHCPRHLSPDVQWVVHSDAIGPENPELRRAAELGIPTATYFQAVGQCMTGRPGIAVAGTHGKSSTTAMLARILVDAGRDPTVFCGASPIGRATGGRAGAGELVLAEACEYRANFLHLRPHVGVVLNVEHDHFDCFPTFDVLKRAFVQFVRNLPPDGLLIVRGDCPVSRHLATEAGCRVETFGLGSDATWSVDRIEHDRGRFRFGLTYLGRHLGRVALRIAGRHSVLNALAAAAVAWQQRIDPAAISRSLGSFPGISRRTEHLGRLQGIELLSDYAHHPTEVVAALETARLVYPGRKLWCVFQPHQASRTARLLDEMAASLQNADRVVVAPIYRAREKAFPPGDITAADLADRVETLGGKAVAMPCKQRIVRWLLEELCPGDVLIIVGAGDIDTIAHELVQRFREDRAAG